MANQYLVDIQAHIARAAAVAAHLRAAAQASGDECVLAAAEGRLAELAQVRRFLEAFALSTQNYG